MVGFSHSSDLLAVARALLAMRSPMRSLGFDVREVAKCSDSEGLQAVVIQGSF